MPPEEFEKLNPLRLNLRAFLMVYCLDYYSKAAHCRMFIVQLFDQVVDYIISVRNCITSLRDDITTIRSIKNNESHYNKKSVHEYYYMLRWVSMQLQKSTFAASVNAWILAV